MRFYGAQSYVFFSDDKNIRSWFFNVYFLNKNKGAFNLE